MDDRDVRTTPERIGIRNSLAGRIFLLLALAALIYIGKTYVF